MVKIFDINEGNIVINENCLLIPELKAIMETYENPIPVFGYVHYMSDPRSPYRHLPDAEKEEMIMKDYPGDYTIDDEPVYKAVEKLRQLCETPNMKLLEDAKIGLAKVGKLLRNNEIRDDDKNGNFATYMNALKSVYKISLEYSALERGVEEELRVRGQGNVGYDEV